MILFKKQCAHETVIFKNDRFQSMRERFLLEDISSVRFHSLCQS